jgi:protein-L-isoaspartate(D-aspartate) O-methyltransferase
MVKTICDLDGARRRFAAEIAGAGGQALERAFAEVRREDFLPPPPWTIYCDGAALTTSDPESLYRDVLVAIDVEKGINNGQPSLHAQWLSAIEPLPGERVLHVGCGGGYYSAILAALVGPEGHVLAYEIEPSVAALARRALAGSPNVEVREGSGAAGAFAQVDVIQVDVIYVNAAAEAPERAWIEALAPGGRLIFPWRYGSGEVTTLIARSQDAHPPRFAALTLGGVQFIGLREGSQSRASASDYAQALRVRELVLRSDRAPDDALIADFRWAWFSA